MLRYDNIKVVRTDIRNGGYNNKKGKYVDYKKPKITKKTLETDNSCYDLGELFSGGSENSEIGLGELQMEIVDSQSLWENNSDFEGLYAISLNLWPTE